MSDKFFNKISVLGSGWLGLPLTQHLSELGFQTKTSTRSSTRAEEIRDQDVDVCVFDIENIEKSDLSFLEANILIINITSKNLEAFKELVLRIEESPIENIVFISSTSVYQNLNRIVAEDEGAEDLDSLLYKIENLFRFNIRFKTTVIRFAGLVGYSRHPGKWFANKPVTQPDSPVNLIHRDDCIEIINAVLKNSAWDEEFNGCSTEHPTKREFYTHTRELLGLSAPEFSENDELKFKIVSNEKVKKQLKYEFKYPDPYGFEFD